jgi:hypothetical protein
MVALFVARRRQALTLEFVAIIGGFFFFPGGGRGAEAAGRQDYQQTRFMIVKNYTEINGSIWVTVFIRIHLMRPYPSSKAPRK